MIYNILFLILVAGVPYYLVLEKISFIDTKHIFWISATFLLSVVVLSLYCYLISN